MVEAHQGIALTDQEIRHQNPSTVIPKIISDAMQSNITCSTLPEWTRQSIINNESGKTSDLLVPDNPPNSPTPPKKHVTLKYTHSETYRRLDNTLELNDLKTAEEYAHLPLVMRTRHNGLASRPVEGISIIGQKLDQNYPPLPPHHRLTEK